MAIFDVNNMPDIDSALAIDTNVLVYIFYSKSNLLNLDTQAYSNYFAELIKTKAELIVTTFNLAELFHVIEKNEKDIYCSKSYRANMSFKQYKNTTGASYFLMNELNLVYNQIKAIPQIRIIDTEVPQQIVSDYVSCYKDHSCDFFDFALIRLCNENGFSVLSHDRDFAIDLLDNDLYTANSRVLNRNKK